MEMEAAVESLQLPNWLDLPPEVTSLIFHKIGPVDILESAQKVCTIWRQITKDPSLWRSIDFRNTVELQEFPYDLEKMCQHAVDRSHGQLQTINIECFGTLFLLNYIADRAPQLKSLRLVCCDAMSEEGLCEVAKKLPNLEEFHMFFTMIPIEAFESFGRCCPKLKSFTYNIQGSKVPYIEDEGDREALTIAQTMPELRHLSLFGNLMSNKGLQAILDGCPHLESLDIRQCFNVDLHGDMGKICARRIMNLKRPNDSTDGYEFDATVYDGRGYSSYEDEYPSGFSDIDVLSDADEYYEFSDDGGYMSDDYDGLFLY